MGNGDDLPDSPQEVVSPSQQCMPHPVPLTVFQDFRPTVTPTSKWRSWASQLPALICCVCYYVLQRKTCIPISLPLCGITTRPSYMYTAILHSLCNGELEALTMILRGLLEHHAWRLLTGSELLSRFLPQCFL